MVSCAFVGFWAFYFLWCLLLFFRYYNTCFYFESHGEVYEGALLLRILSPVVALRDCGIGLDLRFFIQGGGRERERATESHGSSVFY